MNKRAIKVDLSIFFDDERKMSYILVDPNWESVACLQRRVELLLDIDSVRFISDGCFLPPQESIEIIKFCDDLKAFVPKESLEKKKKKSKKYKTMEILEECENEETICAGSHKQQQKKRKSDCLQTSIPQNDVPFIPKKSKASNKLLSFEITNSEDEMLKDFNNDNDEVNSALSKNTKVSISKVIEDYERFEGQNQGEKSQIKEMNFSSTPKEKKISKILDNNVEETLNEEMETERPSDIPSCPILTKCKFMEKHDAMNNSPKPGNPNNPFTNAKSNVGHVYFDECGEIVNSVTKSNSSQRKGKQPKTLIVFRCPLNDVTNGTETQKPRVFNLESKNLTKSKISKQVVEIQEDIILPLHPAQKSIIELSLTNDRTIKKDDVGKQKETNESSRHTNEADCLNKSNLVYSKIETDSTTTGKNDPEEQVSAGDLEVSDIQEANVTKEQNESQMELTNIDGDITKAQNKSQVEVTHIDENVTELKDESELELTNIDENAGKGQNKSQTEQKNGEVQLDCVDLSIEEEEYEEVTSDESVKEKHDLTAEDENNKSSASDIEEISEIIDLNESEDNCKNKFNNSTQRKSSITNKDAEDIKVNKILPFCSDLKVLPNDEDIVVFKVPFVNSKTKVKCTTKFMAGKVEHVNRRTKAIQILVIDGVSELCYVPIHLFFSNMDNSLDSSLNGRHLKLKLTDMREPKLFSTN